MEHLRSDDGYIMIVDDNPVNLKLLAEMLEDQHYEVRSFPLGRLALAAAAKYPPDLILLDINMPEMNGYEVCERLKAHAALANIPVVFLSALDKVEDKVTAFQAGAADYIAKPFRLEEVQARVKTHLSVHRLQRALQLQNHHLEQTVAARTRELAEANARLTILDRSKSEFLKLISHEFRTPLNGLLGVSELILEQAGSNAGSEKLSGVYRRSRRRILSILDDALLLTEIDGSQERFNAGTVALRGLLARALERASEFAESRQVRFIQPPANPALVFGGEELLVKALHALLETAVKFAQAGELIVLSEEARTDFHALLIETTGAAVPEPVLGRFFDLFAIGDAITPGGDLGLGPPVAARILSLFGASVSVANRVPAGIRLEVLLRSAHVQNDLPAAETITPGVKRG